MKTPMISLEEALARKAELVEQYWANSFTKGTATTLNDQIIEMWTVIDFWTATPTQQLCAVAQLISETPNDTD